MLFLGLDGGGTGCRARLVDGAGTTLREASAGPANVATDPEGALTNIRTAVTEALNGTEPGGLRAVFGLAGTNLSGAGPRIEAAFDFPTHVVQDVTTTLRGALRHQDGIVAAIGTGSVFARQMDGHTRVIGGWGLRLGDEASGAWMGRALLIRVTQMLDGLVTPTPLLAEIGGELGGAPGVVRFSLQAAPADYAAFMPRILAAREDPAARAILDAARAEIRRAITRLQPTDRAPLPVTWTGGLGPVLALSDWPSLPARGTSLDGAVWMARQEETWSN
ncbi:BadF/BadG/BcrA/BcrD ATPase family protein [Pseudothioclava nitratireducens]|uniref:BadF/BadG/BcrA/BcrD ATPase family protein n=1 Tax=Pseudothioclava nitratireducens TaxID=1928646 RepID=UPI0023DA3D3D|nr:BadF/BadG/BcrA/BcrD ATPase family protein [Defluviimonas nitratireducens]MDF1619815.1 BadF/BadG/BcrA/BcrD ATPase family protein [Defluviimonas nitratireducens]